MQFIIVFFFLMAVMHSFYYAFTFIFPQYKKHRLSVGQTNNYAKSVVNMADLVSCSCCIHL